MKTPLLGLLHQNWWLILLRGIAAIAFGIFAFFWPALTLLSLVLLFGVYAFADGILALTAAFRHGAGSPRGWLVVTGLLGLLTAALTVIFPGITALGLIFLIAAWSIVSGIATIVGAVRLRQEIKGEWLLVLSGALSVIFGVLVSIFPGAGALTLVWLIAGYAIGFGALLVGFAFLLHRHRPDPPSETAFSPHSHPA